MMLRGIIAALWNAEISPTDVKPGTVFFLNSCLLNLEKRISLFKAAGKNVYVDIDFVSGLEGNEDGLKFLMKMGTDGIITTRMRTHNIAGSFGIPCVLRFFALDSRAVEKGLQQVVGNRLKFIEILPGPAAVKVAPKIRALSPNTQIVAAGLIDSFEELQDLRESVDAVSTSSHKLWEFSW